MTTEDEKYLRSIKPIPRTAEEERAMLVGLWGRKPSPEEKEVKAVCELGARLEKEQLDAEAKAIRSKPVRRVSEMGSDEKPVWAREVPPWENMR